MRNKVILTFLFLSLAAVSNAGMDTLTHHYKNSFAAYYNLSRQFWDPSISWKNKPALPSGRYVNGDPAKQKVKVSLLFFSINKPSFLTDGWHLLKAFMLMFIFFSSVIWIPVDWRRRILLFSAFAVLWSVVFELSYK